MERRKAFMDKTILFVDDDIRVVTALQRSLHKDYRIEIAGGPKEALDLICDSHYAVIVSDLEMPEMNGIEFLTRAKHLSPGAIRILLTGRADLDAAIAAVNDNHIFRFLTKPCPQQTLTNTLDAALAQYRLECAESESLKETLMGTVGALLDVLGVAQPIAFARTLRVRRHMRDLAAELNLNHLWEIEAAALLSQIGCISVAPDILAKYYAGADLSPDERRQILLHPHVGRKLLQRVPRLHTVGHIIERQFDGFESTSTLEPEALTRAIGTHALRVAIDFEDFVASGLSPDEAFARMQRHEQQYNPVVLDALRRLIQGNARPRRELGDWDEVDIALSEQILFQPPAA
jgi:response regulator RpfG family c-di-GMP phosphodiesterase